MRPTLDDLPIAVWGAQRTIAVPGGGPLVVAKAPGLSSLLTGLVAYYPFETLTTDATGNGHTLTNNNGTTQTTGKIGQAAAFASASNQTLTGTSLGITSQLSVSFWGQPNISNLGVYVGDLSGTNGWRVISNAGNIVRVIIGGAASPRGIATDTFGAGVYTHVAFVYDGSQPDNATRLKIWVNGVAQTVSFTGTIPATIPYTAAALTVGPGSGGDCFVDEVGIWNVALTPSQIASLYNGGAGRTYPFVGAA